MLINSGSFNLAPDDRIYIVQTDQSGLLSLLMAPPTWIFQNASAVLTSPFTITFYRSASSSTAVVVEGVSGTALANIRTSSPPSESSNFNILQPHVDVVLVDGLGLAYVHLELGTDVADIANFLVSAINNPSALIALLNQATQEVVLVTFNSSGQPVETPLPNTDVNFSVTESSLNFVFQSRIGNDEDISGCNIDYGTWTPPVGATVNVSVETIAVKAY